MRSQLKPSRSPFPSDSVERILGRYYQQLVEWGRILARGDEAAAEETVQDLCLHLTVAQPDMSRVENLDNYLYMCLRNMYVSNLARVSRERLRVVQVEDYDAIGMVASRSGMDTVDVQNELLRICDYALARKYSSKSASHFILHFFLGYRRSDIALLARTPIAAVYNGLKDARAELRQHLSAGERIRIVPRGAKPERQPLWVAMPSHAFLKDVRTTVFDADSARCISEHELVDTYRRPAAPPLECRELAHIAGCARCLQVLQRVLRLDDHDGPLDGVDVERESGKDAAKSFDVVMRMVRKRQEQLLERRPALLAIAVDGRVVAFHAVESAHNSLSSRLDGAAILARFVEVFDEFGDRLAHIPLESESTATPPERLSQKIELSDDRRLRLEVRFDGLGIHAEVDYVDPALAPSEAAEERPEYARPSFWARFRKPVPFRFAPWGAFALATVLLAAVASVGGYRYTHPAWRDVLTHAQAVVAVPSPTEMLHQTLRIEENGAAIGSVDVWRSSDSRVVRRLYNTKQQLIATSMEAAGGAASVHLEENATANDREFVASGVWRSDVSTGDLATRETTADKASRSFSGFELTQHEERSGGTLVRTLVLDRNYRAQAERVRFETRGGVREIRLVQTLLRRVPTNEVPAGTFPEANDRLAPVPQSERNLAPQPSGSAGAASGANLQVAVLFALFQKNADTGQPIEVTPLAGGRVRVTGTLANAQMLADIRERIATLPDVNRVDFQVYSAAEAASAVHRGKAFRQELAESTSDAPAAGLVRDALLARGSKGADLDKAEQEFAASALAHAQIALQHAYALDRLGTVLRGAGQASIAPDARIEWAQMVERHSSAALTEFAALRLQLDSVSSGVAVAPVAAPHGIADATAFIRVTSELRARAQIVNEQVVKLFAGSAADLTAAQARDAIARIQTALPLAEVGRMRAFASRLNSRQNEVGEIGSR